MTSLHEATIAALKAYPPFDHVGASSLRFLAARLQLGYYPRATAIVTPEGGVVQTMYIIKQGRVRGFASGGSEARAAADVALGAGECFPLGALAGRRAVVYTYRAEEDCFCWELTADDFHKLVQRSPRFSAFCRGHVAALLERSQRALCADAGETMAGGMLRPLREVLSRAPVSCAPDTPVREALKTMHDLRIGSMVVAEDGVPKGIFTVLDVLDRVALPRADVSAPISSLMSGSVVALEEEAPVVEAALAMVHHHIRHVVITRDGRLTGVISERDLFGMQRISLRRIVERVRIAQVVPQLAEAAAGVRSLAHSLLAQGVAAEQLTQMASALNDGIAQRVVALASQKHALRGEWCWLALGSEGRLEQTLATDQDNALIIADGSSRQVFLAFAGEVNEALAACGFPLCKGEIMARNPKWCLSLEEWRALFSGWIRNPQPEALLNASIFFDFRALAGEARLAGELRSFVLRAASGNKAFQRAMAASALQSRPPEDPLLPFLSQAETLDLKGNGARAFVDGARLLALAHGLAATSTAARLRGAAKAGALPQAEAAAFVDAFHFIQMLRLRRQYLEAKVAPATENQVTAARLNAIDQRILKEAFRQARILQQRLQMDYAV